jgi:hypothetical protein
MGTGAPDLRPLAIPRRAHPLYGDGQKVRDWLYLEDQVIATRAEGLGFISTPTAPACLLQKALLWSPESNAGMISPTSLISMHWSSPAAGRMA